jgi:IS5 family transposase
MDRCWLKGQTGDALHAVLCAAGYNIRWLLRAIVRLGLKGLFAPIWGLLASLRLALAIMLGIEKPRCSIAFGVLG